MPEWIRNLIPEWLNQVPNQKCTRLHGTRNWLAHIPAEPVFTNFIDYLDTESKTKLIESEDSKLSCKKIITPIVKILCLLQRKSMRKSVYIKLIPFR